MHKAVHFLVGCGFLMAAEAAVMRSSAPALVSSVRCAGDFGACRERLRRCAIFSRGHGRVVEKWGREAWEDADMRVSTGLRR